MKLVGLVVAVVLGACGGSDSKVDAQAGDVASQIDGAGSGSGSGSADIKTACKDVCDQIAACIMQPPDPMCNSKCEADLTDCTPQQVQDVDACKTQCGQDAQDIGACLMMISCVMG